MKKLLCYLGILILLGLAILPLALRMFLPDYEEKEEASVLNESILLICKNEKYEVNATYEASKINMFAIKKYKNKNEVESNDKLINQEDSNKKETELDRMFKYLKNANNIIYSDLETAEVIGIDFSIYDHKELDLGKITKSSEEQKTYYETQGLTCTVRK